VPDEPPLPEWWHARQAIEDVIAQDRAADDDPWGRIVAWRQRAGLPVDEATIEEVLAHAACGLADPGMWETPQEAARRRRGQALIDASEAAVEAYVQAHVESHTGSWYEWHDHEPTLVVAFDCDVARHAEALSYPGVRVTQRPHPDPALPAILEDLIAAEPPEDTIWWDLAVDEAESLIDVKGSGSNEAAAAAWLSERYGDRVRLTWEPHEEVRSVPWQLWEVPPGAPCAVTVRWKTLPANRLERVEAQETPDSVCITVFELQFKGHNLLSAQYRAATVRLREPIGRRRVLDGVTERERPRL
jgi:hypothetical protein